MGHSFKYVRLRIANTPRFFWYNLGSARTSRIQKTEDSVVAALKRPPNSSISFPEHTQPCPSVLYDGPVRVRSIPFFVPNKRATIPWDGHMSE